MSTKKLVRYLEETNAMFNQEDLKITHQIINDEVRILKLRSNKHIRISDKKDKVTYAKLVGIRSSGCMHLEYAEDGLIMLSINPGHPNYKNSTRQRYHRKHHHCLKHCQERSEASKSQTVIPCPALAGGIFMLNLFHEAAFYDRLQRL